MESKKHAAALMAALVAFAGLALAVPTAAAHTCSSYEGCDATNCPDGEDHDHTDKNYIADDENCKSTSKPPQDPNSCEYFGITWPPIVCRLIEDGTGGGIGTLPTACGSRWAAPDLEAWGDVCAVLHPLQA